LAKKHGTALQTIEFTVNGTRFGFLNRFGMQFEKTNIILIFDRLSAVQANDCPFETVTFLLVEY
jgi:hypothetical protein